MASLFSRRGYNIQSLAVGATEQKNMSRMTIVVCVDESPLEQITKQLNKLIDVGAAFLRDDPPRHPTCTPAYAAPEVLSGDEPTERSDLASLGYVLVETLAGAPPFAGLEGLADLLDAKRTLVKAGDAAAEIEASAKQLHEMIGKLQDPTSDFATNSLPELSRTITSLQQTSTSLGALVQQVQQSPQQALGKPPAKEIEVKP